MYLFILPFDAFRVQERAWYFQPVQDMWSPLVFHVAEGEASAEDWDGSRSEREDTPDEEEDAASDAGPPQRPRSPGPGLGWGVGPGRVEPRGQGGLHTRGPWRLPQGVRVAWARSNHVTSKRR